MKMSARRNTPSSLRGKGVPSNLNFTITSGGKAVSSRIGSASRLSRNLNCTVSVANSGPVIKSNLFPAVSGDEVRELEYGMAYNDYLQALLKREIVSKVIEQYDQDLKDQLVLQKDNLHRNKKTLKKTQREIDFITNLFQITELITVAQENVIKCQRLEKDFDLIGTLSELLALLTNISNKLYSRNIKPISSQENIDELTELLKKSINTFKKIASPVRNVEEINKLGELMKKYQQLVDEVLEWQLEMDKKQKNETSKLLASISDKYAQEGNYDTNM